MPDTCFRSDVERLRELFISYLYSGSIKQTLSPYSMLGPGGVHTLGGAIDE